MEKYLGLILYFLLFVFLFRMFKGIFKVILFAIFVVFLLIYLKNLNLIQFPIDIKSFLWYTNYVIKKEERLWQCYCVGLLILVLKSMIILWFCHALIL